MDGNSSSDGGTIKLLVGGNLKTHTSFEDHWRNSTFPSGPSGVLEWSPKVQRQMKRAPELCQPGQLWPTQAATSLSLTKTAVRGEEPHPTIGAPVMRDTADLGETTPQKNPLR